MFLSECCVVVCGEKRVCVQLMEYAYTDPCVAQRNPVGCDDQPAGLVKPARATRQGVADAIPVLIEPGGSGARV